MRYINWREIAGLPGTKPRKVPWSAAAGAPIDPHDPASWLSEQAVRATGLPVGIVLTDDDPYFLLDLDDCLMPDNAWHPDAVALCSMFPGAAMEVSHNGRGLHVMGRVDAAALGARRHKWDHGAVACEFYHTKRFVALGRGMQGNIDLDWTSVLTRVVPPAAVVATVVLSDAPVPEYTGPENDDELVQIMLHARGSAAAVFGDKATLADLWQGNTAALCRAFPSVSGDEFDRSSADAALMSHLAFYTGKNAARMDRLFRRSALVRDKYLEREDYRVSTISGAVSMCKKVYDKPRVADVPATFASLMSVQEQEVYFRGCVYISSEHAIMVPTGEIMKPAAFKAVYGGHEFLMSADGRKPTMNAFEAFTENRMSKFPKVRRTRFKPQLPFGVPLDESGAVITERVLYADGVNVHMPTVIPTVRGDVAPFLDLLAKMLPVTQDREILLAWMASCVQNQGKKFLWSPVLQGTKGNGKSFIGEVLYYCMGERYSWKAKANKIDARFNSYLRNRTFIFVEEMHMFAKYEMLETLKDYITGTRQEIEGKGTDVMMDADYCANWFFCTNHRDAVIKERDDRRFSVFFTAQQSREDMVRDGMLTGDYFPRLWDWARKGGFAAMRAWLLDYAIPADLDPAGRCFLAPDTSSTAEAIETSYGAAEQYIMEAVASDTVGFRGGWISTWAASKLLKDVGIKRTPRKLAAILENLGYVARGRMTVGLMQEEMSRPHLWSLPTVNGDYAVAQGYVRA